MKMSKVIFACACLAGLIYPAWGQETTAAKPGIRGVVDPATGIFTATPRVVADEGAAAAAIIPTTGKLVVSFTIKLVTPVPSGGSLVCAISAIVMELTPQFSVSAEVFEGATSKATVAGSAATCKATIPYSWNLTNPSKDTVSLQYSLELLGGSTANAAVLARSSSQFVVPGAGAIKVPANGSTTSFNVSATI